MNIFDNPFYILGVSTRDNRERISDAANEKTFLQNDTDAVNYASNSLIIPEKRIDAEFRWFPGVDDGTMKELINFFDKLKLGQTHKSVNISHFRGIALLNFAVYMFGFRKFKDIAELVQSILAICHCFETINIEDVQRIINKDRSAAGFPKIEKAELEHRFYDYRNDILRALDDRISMLSPNKYHELIETLAENYADKDAKYHELLIIGDLLDSYELKIMPILEDQKKIILDALDAEITDKVSEKFFESLQLSSKKYNELINPLKLAANIRGTENGLNEQTIEIVCAVREFSVKLHNEHYRTKDALRLMRILRDYFTDLPDNVLAIINQDIAELKILEQKRQKEECEREEREKSINYETEKILKQLRDGRTLSIGDIRITDNGVYLKKWGLFIGETKFFTWKEPLKLYSDNGLFIIEVKSGSKYRKVIIYERY